MSDTSYLHDEGEEDWGLKLHLGCGSIYLTGYVNIDIAGMPASKHPDLVKQNQTHIKNYYARSGDIYNIPQRKPTLSDAGGDFAQLPYAPCSVDKIVCVQALEHLNWLQVQDTLLHWWSVLKTGGSLIISVPEMDETLDMLKYWDTYDFAARHLRGPRKGQYDYHRAWFTKETLQALLERQHFGQIEFLPNIHFYPALIVRAKKIDPWMGFGREYQLPLPEYDPLVCKTVLDVGPGNYPLPFATHCVDATDEYRDKRIAPGDVGNAESLPYADQSFDFVNCSHSIEHCNHPLQAIAEAQRVGKRGYIECPTVYLDYFCQHGETHPQWMVLGIENGFVFVEKSTELNRGFTDRNIGSFIHRVIHYPLTFNETERNLRFHFWKNNKDVLNVKASWNTEQSKFIQGYEFRLNGEAWKVLGTKLEKLA